MRQVWHLVAALYVAALGYAMVWQGLEVPWPLWLAVACVAEPGAFGKLAMHLGADVVKRIKGGGS